VIGRSDDAGRFVLKGVEPGRHRLRVEGEGLLTAEVRFVDVPGQAVRILIARRAEVRGSVIDSGKPVVGATVRLLPLGGGVALSVASDEDGGFALGDLPEGRYRVWAAAGDRASRAQSVDRLGAGPFAPVQLDLEPAAIVTGQVIDGSTGRGVAAHVTLVADDPDEPTRTATSTAAGAFRIEGVPLGGWTADAFAPGYVSADSVRFQTGAGYAPSVALRRGGVLSGRIVDGSGAPVAGAVVLGRADGGGADVSEEIVARRLGATAGWGTGLAPSSTAGLVTATGQRFLPRGELGVLLGPVPFPPPPGAVSSAVRIASPLGGPPADAPTVPVDPALESRFTTDREGRYRLTGLAPGRYRVLVTHRDFADGASEPRDVELGTALADVDVVMHGGMTLYGVVVDEGGEPIAGAMVAARGERGLDPRRSVTGADGSYRIGPLSADADLEVSAPGLGSAMRRIEIDPAAGRAPSTREENFTLVQADAEIRGRVSDAGGLAVAGATLRVVSGGSAARAVTDGGGRFLLAGVVGGRHRVRVEHPDFPAAEREITTGADSEIRLDAGGAMEIEVRDRAGAAVAGAKLVARGPDGGTRRATTDRRGAARLSPLAAGTWAVQATARGYADGVVDVEIASSTRPGEIPAAAVRIDLGRGAILAGVVRDQNGERLSGARVAVGNSRTTTDADGRFRLTQVMTGPVVIEAEKDGASGALELELAPGDELVTLELRVQ
jgi:protocatechuate 3,4-dioxygenase beta subunit